MKRYIAGFFFKNVKVASMWSFNRYLNMYYEQIQQIFQN